jgi:hypothetical protein
MRKMTLTNSLPKTSLGHMKKRFIERRRRTLENGVISIKSPSTTLMNVAQNSHWWETYWEKISTKESGIYGAEPTWDFFVDVVKE